MTEAYKKVLAFIEKNLEKEKGKWEVGMKNKYFQWLDMREDFLRAFSTMRNLDEIERNKLMEKKEDGKF